MTAESIRPAPALRPPGGGGFDDAPPDDPSLRMAQVLAGVHDEHVPVAGMTVGEVRRRYGQTLDIAPGAIGYIGGAPVGDDTVVRPGQVLSYIRHSGSKGVRARRVPAANLMELLAALRAAEPDGAPVPLADPDPDLAARRAARRAAGPFADDVPPPSDAGCWLRLIDDRVEVLMPEGVVDTLSVEELMGLIVNRRKDGRDLFLPPGVRAILPQSDGTIFVHEAPPRVVPLKWIAADSPDRAGSGATYRIVSVSVPWTLVLCVFRQGPDGALTLSGSNECFFRHERLRSLDDALLFPALLNCSRSSDPRDTRRSWICTQKMDRAALTLLHDPRQQVARSIEAVVEHLWTSGFNYSPEASGMKSWFGSTIAARVHPRLTSIESWAAASAEDPRFALGVPWLPARQTLREAAVRMGGESSPAYRPFPRTARHLARIVLNRRRS
jgi:hypothetical protein